MSTDMSKETIKLERELTRIVGRSRFGGVTMAIQYHDEQPWSDDQAPASAPIYVGFDGDQGRPLDEVLAELNAYKKAFGEPKVLERVASLQGDIHSQMNMIQRANQRITELEKRPRGIIERLRSRRAKGIDAKANEYR